MNDFIEALKETKKENKDFKITLSRNEVLEITKEIERLHSIIKEVREYAKDNQFTAHLDIQTNKVTKIENGEMTDILEILDKENK